MRRNGRRKKLCDKDYINNAITGKQVEALLTKLGAFDMPLVLQASLDIRNNAWRTSDRKISFDRNTIFANEKLGVIPNNVTRKDAFEIAVDL